MARHKTVIGILLSPISNLFDKLPKTAKGAIHIGVSVVEVLKRFTDSKTVDIITMVIPSEIDNKVKDTLRAKLPAILTGLKLAENCGGKTDINDIITCVVDTISKMTNNNDKGRICRQISAEVINRVHGKMDLAEAEFLSHVYYHKYIKK